jgi:hypothetical protein
MRHEDTSGSGNDGPAKAPTGIPILAGIQGMLPAHPRAAFRAEVGSDSTPRLRGSAVCLGRAFDLHATPGKVSVHGIGASGAPLANLAVTHGDDVRIALYVQSVGPQMGAQCLQARGLPGNLSRAHAAIVSTSGARGAPKHGSALLLSEAHRTVHRSQEADPSLRRGAALVAAATLVADPLHQSPPAHGVFRAVRIRAYQRRHAIEDHQGRQRSSARGSIPAALPSLQRPTPRIRSVSTRQKFAPTWRH